MNINLPHLQLLHGENSPKLSGLPASADRETRLGEVLHFTCERDQEIKWDCMERLVTRLGGVPQLPGVRHLHMNKP